MRFGDGDWQAKIVDRFDRLDIVLYLYRDTPAGKEVLLANGTAKLIKEGDPDQGLEFATFRSADQLHALGAALSSFGVKTDDEHKLAGVLDAQTKHLEDMRALVFKRKPS